MVSSMRERSSSPSVLADATAEDGSVTPPEATPRTVPSKPPAFVTAGHDVLFVDDSAARCEICAAEVSPDPDDGSSYTGSALYISIRGDRVIYDEPPLCPSCALAIGVTALARWDIEEEEG